MQKTNVEFTDVANLSRGDLIYPPEFIVNAVKNASNLGEDFLLIFSEIDETYCNFIIKGVGYNLSVDKTSIKQVRRVITKK